MERINKICVAIFACVVAFIIGYYIGNDEDNKVNNDDVIIVDTTYNKVKIDSIEVNIRTKDSTIIKLKTKMDYEIQKAINATDSNAVKQFYELVGSY